MVLVGRTAISAGSRFSNHLVGPSLIGGGGAVHNAGDGRLPTASYTRNGPPLPGVSGRGEPDALWSLPPPLLLNGEPNILLKPGNVASGARKCDESATARLLTSYSHIVFRINFN